MKNDWDLQTCCIRLGLGTSSVSKEVRELGSNQNIVHCDCLGVKPHETHRIHVLEEGHRVVVRHNFPIVGIVLSVLAKEMGEVALSIAATEIQAGAGSVLEVAFIRQGFYDRCPLFDVEEAHL